MAIVITRVCGLCVCVRVSMCLWGVLNVIVVVGLWRKRWELGKCF